MFNTVETSVLEGLAQYESALVQNAGILVRGHVPADQDYSGPELKCMTPEKGTRVGFAITVRIMPNTPQPGSLDHDIFYDTVAYSGVPTIVVFQDVESSPCRGAVFGDEMAYRLNAIGCRGAMVEGSVRDVSGIASAGLGLWSHSRVPGHGDSSWLSIGEPVSVAGLRIEQGDILVCDADGVTRVTADSASQVLEKCGQVREKEAATFSYMSDPNFTLEKYEAWKKIRRNPK
ncbi:MAG TPA: hypothetical protein EYO83_12260 [Gemmatimonadetes bacterium]|nr:hypothetical protein [Gemmatimonadota bacterium]